MIQPLQRKAQEAMQVSQVWDSYFPTLPVAVEHWRFLLDSYTAATITKAIQRCVKKRLALNGNITHSQMLSFVESVCFRKQKVQQEVQH